MSVLDKLLIHFDALLTSPMFWITPVVVALCAFPVVRGRLDRRELMSMIKRNRIDLEYFFLSQASLTHVLGYLLTGGTLYVIFQVLLAVFGHFAASRTIEVDGVLIAVVYFLALDFFGYWAHRISHSSKILWCFHCVHHSAPRFNLIASFRNHPIDAAFSRIVVVVPLTVFSFVDHPALAVATILYLSSVKALNVLQHGNFALPGFIDRLIIVPQAHRIHHSVDAAHFDSNFGGVFSIWDRLFGTYVDWRDVPGVLALPIGLSNFNPVSFLDSILLPIKGCWRAHVRRWR